MDVYSLGRFLMEQRFIPDCALALQETGFRIMNVKSRPSGLRKTIN